MSRLPNIFRRFERDEGGAILILALVAMMILMLLAMTLYDAGGAARDKAEVQASADTAAYSQAAVKARSMNMLAYSNISKRSIWGVHSLYPSYLKSMHRWIISTINSNCPSCDDPNDNNCKKCRAAKRERDRWIGATCEGGVQDCPIDSNFRLLSGRDYSDKLSWADSDEGTRIADTDSDWADPLYIETHDFGAKDDTPATLFEAYVAEDMRALDNYQRYIFGLTPWWGWTEHLVKAVRNGATMSSSWPAPVGAFPMSLSSMINNLIAQFRGLFGGAGAVTSAGFTLYADSLPVYPGKVGTMQGYMASAINDSSVRGCLLAMLQGGSCTDHIDPFLLEHIANALIFWLKSEGVLAGDYTDLDQVQGMAATIGLHYKAVFQDFVDVGLPYTQNSFENILGKHRIIGEPWLLRPGESAAHWQLSTSNIVLTYQARMGVYDDNRDRQKFGIVGEDHRGDSLENLVRRSRLYGTPTTPMVSGADMVSQELTYNASGYWAMARSEIFFNADSPPDLWHPSWSSRLRPMSIDDEFLVAGYSLNHVYHDAIAGFALAAALGITELSDIFTALSDLAYMEKATLSMGESTIEGVSK
jgi:hypothetical protein